ncbi:hypothetical protein [Kiloniella litopenaei]|uniref:hypothetical protein n=1 Tax=Kiloniella litopenaei TaxID=1549748 RepID=UPI003BA96EB0
MTSTSLSSQDKTKLTFLFDCYGAHPHRWPEDRREWASNLIKQYPEARVLRDQALELDNFLDKAPAEPNSSHLMHEILAQAPQKKYHQDLKTNLLYQLWPFESIWRPLSALTTAGLFGILLGTSSPSFLYNQDVTEIESAYLEFSLGDSFSNNFPEGEID